MVSILHNGGTSVNGVSRAASPFGVEKGDKIYWTLGGRSRSSRVQPRATRSAQMERCMTRVFRDLATRQAGWLLRAGFSGLSMLCLKRCRCVELLLTRASISMLPWPARPPRSPCRGRDPRLTEAAGGERQTDHER